MKKNFLKIIVMIFLLAIISISTFTNVTAKETTEEESDCNFMNVNCYVLSMFQSIERQQGEVISYLVDVSFKGKDVFGEAMKQFVNEFDQIVVEMVKLGFAFWLYYIGYQFVTSQTNALKRVLARAEVRKFVIALCVFSVTLLLVAAINDVGQIIREAMGTAVANAFTSGTSQNVGESLIIILVNNLSMILLGLLTLIVLGTQVFATFGLPIFSLGIFLVNLKPTNGFGKMLVKMSIIFMLFSSIISMVMIPFIQLSGFNDVLGKFVLLMGIVFCILTFLLVLLSFAQDVLQPFKGLITAINPAAGAALSIGRSDDSSSKKGNGE